MFRKLELMLRIVCMSALFMCMRHTSAAQELARAFAATYELNNVVEDGSHVQVTMALTLLNTSGGDVKGGIVAVLSSQPSPILLGSFAPIKDLPQRGQVTVSHTFTIASAEYAAWQSGHAPRLQFLMPSGNGAVAAGIQAHQIVTPAKAN